MLYGSPLAAIGNAIRGIVCAAPGHKLISADLANIESRVLSWLAGEQWKLDTFSAYDTFLLDEQGNRIPKPGKPGEFERAGPDVYEVGYSRSFGVDVSSVTGTERLIGKVQELALGYQGGVGAFQTMSRTLGVNIGQSFDMLREASPQFAERAEAAFADRGEASGIPERDWVAAEIVKLGWRDANPRIVQLWADLEAAAIQALDKPNDVVQCGRVNFLKRGSFLWVQLPSGRPLCYPYPRLSEKEMPWRDKKSGKPARKLTFTFKTEVNRSWVDSYAYGGLWAENVTQAAARDILADALKRLDAAGYPPVLHAHDEAVAEVPLGYGSVEEFCRIMSEVPYWASGCPISAAGWEGARYRKG
jgi:DNA polymerase